MPFIPQVPETITATITMQKEVDVFQVDNIQIHIDHNTPGNSFIDIFWSKGFMDGENYVMATQATIRATGLDFANLATQLVTPGDTMYDTIKKGCWNYLLLKGVVSTGTIE
jgi:hypothetical protein